MKFNMAMGAIVEVYCIVPIINPAEPAHSIQEKIRYLGSGKLKLDDPILNDQINQVLNLNYYRLNENRKAVIDAVQHVLARTKGSATTGGLQRLLQDWSSLDRQGKHKSFCGAAIYYLNKKQQKIRKIVYICPISSIKKKILCFNTICTPSSRLVALINPIPTWFILDLRHTLPPVLRPIARLCST